MKIISKPINALFPACCFIVLLLSCSRSSGDSYLHSLKLQAIPTETIEHFPLENVGIIFPLDLLKFDDWYILRESKGDFNITAVNPVEKRKYDFIRRGRGPGEMVNGVSLHRFGKKAIISDRSSSTCIALDIDASINSGYAVMDTLGRFGSNPARPCYLVYTGGGFISTNLLDDDSFYSFYDSNGNILSNVRGFGFDSVKNCSDHDFLASLRLGSLYTVSPSGENVCVASTGCTAISFATLKDGKLKETKRYEIAPPDITSRGGYTVFKKEGTSTFNAICSDASFVYLLYSGNPLFGGAVPGYECRHLLVYNWSGKPERHYVLSNHASSIYVEDGIAYCGTSFPEAGIFMYQLDL